MCCVLLCHGEGWHGTQPARMARQEGCSEEGGAAPAPHQASLAQGTLQHPQPLKKRGGVKCQNTLNTPKGIGDGKKLHQTPLAMLLAVLSNPACLQPGASRHALALTRLCLKEGAAAGCPPTGMRNTSTAGATSAARHCQPRFRKEQ